MENWDNNRNEKDRRTSWALKQPNRKRWWRSFMNMNKTRMVNSKILNILDEASPDQLRSYVKKYGKRLSNSNMPTDINAAQMEQINRQNANTLRQNIAMSVQGAGPIVKANVANYFTRRRNSNNNLKTARNFKEIFNKPKKSWWPWGSKGGKRRTRRKL